RQSGTNLLTSITDALSRTTTFTYDSWGDLASTTRLYGTGNAVTTSTTREPNFRQIASVTDPLNHTTTVTHDNRGNAVTITNPLSQQTTVAYNANGQLVSITSPLNHTVQFTYNNADLVAVTDHLGRTSTRLIDAVGRPMAIANAAGHQTKKEFDSTNQRTKKTD